MNTLPLAPRGAPVCDDGHCVTCSDEGVAMRVMALDDSGLAECVDASGRMTTVMTGIVPDVRVGERVLVHAGTALIRLPAEASA